MKMLSLKILTIIYKKKGFLDIYQLLYTKFFASKIFKKQ